MKSLFSFVLSVSLVIMPMQALAQSSVTITDMDPSHWGYKSAQYMVDHEYLQATNGTFNPNTPLTRAQVVKMIMKEAQKTGSLEASGDAIQLSETSGSNVGNVFNDVSKDSPYHEYIMDAYKAGVVSGIGSGRFAPGEPVTRAQFIKILFEANNEVQPDIQKASFSDIDSQHWVFPYAELASQMGVVSGINGDFVPDAQITRAQGAKILYEYLKYKGHIVWDTESYEKLMFWMINTSRQEAGKANLEYSEELANVARNHAINLAKNNLRSSHCGVQIAQDEECPEENTPFARITRAGVDYKSAAENIAWASSNNRPILKTIYLIHADENYGMISEPKNEDNHRANIYGTFHDFNTVGVGVYIQQKEGKREVYVVQNFIEK